MKTLNVASDLGLHCLPMSQKWDARLVWVKARNPYNINICGYVMRLAAYDFSVFEYHA